ncbi:hypothetical protein NUU61_009639 [Penicillium alfredii]|uniref:Signal peptidase complex subunit 1 n=1 Tax=Penicillium alfredii TaxID=1506179 RepID=A0A9W9JTR6_9EURO|nr:uncharacterized protein NUU61_009639 [Penicillium alfredii]KAJ5081375.1 hypothetical protein NUU61_009639 [Penicillium alfredii]
MDDLLAPLQDFFEGQIDFHGQRLAEILSTVLLIISAAVGFVVGYIYKDIHQTLWISLAGTVFTAVVVVPPWPFFNKNPEKWLVPAGGKASGSRVVVDGIKVA